MKKYFKKGITLVMFITLLTLSACAHWSEGVYQGYHHEQVVVTADYIAFSADVWRFTSAWTDEQLPNIMTFHAENGDGEKMAGKLIWTSHGTYLYTEDLDHIMMLNKEGGE